MRSQACAPTLERWQPEILIWVLAGRRSRSAWLLVNGTRRSRANSSTCSSRSRRRSSRLRVLDCLRPSRRRWVASPHKIACRQFSSSGSAISGGIWVQAVVAGGVGGVVQPVQGIQRRVRPGLARVGFGGGDQFAGDVRTAQRVRRSLVLLTVIDRQGIVDNDPGVAGQHREVVDRGPAPAVMQVVGGQLVGAGHVQPLLAAVDVQAGLVHVQQVCCGDRGLDQLLAVGQRLAGGREHTTDPAGRTARPRSRPRSTARRVRPGRADRRPGRRPPLCQATGALTPAGAAAVVTHPQPQRRLCSRCSVTLTVTAGMSRN